MALTSIFLKLFIDGKPVKGESQAKGYEGQIEVESFNWALSSKLHAKGSGDIVEVETRVKHLKFSKVYDAATGLLIQTASKKEKEFSTARFTLTSMVLSSRGANNLSKMLEMVLSDGQVEEVSLSASEGKDSMSLKEDVTLSYRKCKLLYYPLDGETFNRGAAMTFELMTNSTT